jgi:hypothetical protein
MLFEDVREMAKKAVQGEISRLKSRAEVTRQGTSSE